MTQLQLYNTSCEMLKRHYINLCILAPNYAHPLPPNSENIALPPLKFVSKKLVLSCTLLSSSQILQKVFSGGPIL